MTYRDCPCGASLATDSPWLLHRRHPGVVVDRAVGVVVDLLPEPLFTETERRSPIGGIKAPSTPGSQAALARDRCQSRKVRPDRVPQR
jgi:hypothetical protein